jgi:hypothetical protein
VFPTGVELKFARQSRLALVCGWRVGQAYEYVQGGPQDDDEATARIVVLRPRMQSPAGPVIIRCLDDSEPDGADDLTSWLEQQFKSAA